MNENMVDINEFLDQLADRFADRLTKGLIGGEKSKEIEELEQTNHEIIEKNKALLEENKNLRWQYEQGQTEKDKLMEEIEALRKENERLKWAERKRASWEEAFHKMFIKAQALQNKLETLEQEKEKKEC
jgi:predicted nuclease with TOPRIM domain